MKTVILFLVALFCFSCGVEKRLGKAAQQQVLNEETLRTAHVGISVYEPATGKYWFNYQGDKYFVPASNTKIPTCYAVMKNLGDSLVGLKYDDTNPRITKIEATGDPTFLHSDFKKQPVLDFLKNQNSIVITNVNWREKKWGSGWSWNDYAATYMAERSPFPVYGNVVVIKARNVTKSDEKISTDSSILTFTFHGPFTFPSMFKDSIHEYAYGDRLQMDSFVVTREFATNQFRTWPTNTKFIADEFPFVTYGYKTSVNLLSDTLKKKVEDWDIKMAVRNIIHSQPTDSLLRPMMHRSDNFFAEQTLLMVSNELLGYMNDEKIIDTLLKTDFKDLPQKPRWVDGSGLSRYNLFTPQDFVFILNKMKNDFGMSRIKNILATGNEGTLRNYYVKEKDFIYAKTGTLSGVVALSGFLTTKKGKELILSVQVNNHTGSATDVRRAVEKFIEGIRENF